MAIEHEPQVVQISVMEGIEVHPLWHKLLSQVPSTTSSVTYNVRFYNQYAANTTLYLNRGGNGENNAV